MSVAVRILTTWLVVGIGSVVLTAQHSAKSLLVLPNSVPLSEVEIRWQCGGGDGCKGGGCTNYRIAVRGDGRVTLEDLGRGGNPPKAAPQQRSISADDAVVLINQLLKARFLEAFEGTRVAVRKGNSLFFYGPGGGSGPWVDLTLRVGPSAKTVRVDERTPTELQSLRDRIWKIGGPKAWPVR
jgi:hypothetical protein